MKNIALLFIAVFATTLSFAQPGKNKNRDPRVASTGIENVPMPSQTVPDGNTIPPGLEKKQHGERSAKIYAPGQVKKRNSVNNRDWKHDHDVMNGDKSNHKYKNKKSQKYKDHKED